MEGNETVKPFVIRLNNNIKGKISVACQDARGCIHGLRSTPEKIKHKGKIKRCLQASREHLSMVLLSLSQLVRRL
jgi:hypothetical protein